MSPFVEIAVDILESTAESEDARLDVDVDNAATPETRIGIVVESVADTLESTAESEDATSDNAVVIDAIPEARSWMWVESVAEMLESISERDDVDADNEPDIECISELRVAVSFTRPLVMTVTDCIRLSKNRGSFEIALVICSRVSMVDFIAGSFNACILVSMYDCVAMSSLFILGTTV